VIKLALQIAIVWAGLAATLCAFVWMMVGALVRAFGRPAEESISSPTQQEDEQLSTRQASDTATA
jgi:hypothetical protein